MKLLRELLELQHEHGWLSDDTLRDVASRRNVPLYHVEGLVSFYTHFRRTPPPRVEVQVCRDLACWMAGCGRFAVELRERFRGRDDVEIREVSCLGRCDAAPAAAINDVPLAPATLACRDEVTRLIERPPTSFTPPPPRRALRVDPYASEAEHFGTARKLAAGGPAVLEGVIDQLKQAGLRGMGGAGFPTGMKWELVSKQTATPKYVVCNADESEPGTFKDRFILEHLPHLVVEGVILAGLVVGAEQGIVYLRHEYAPEQRSLEAALERARAVGGLGENACGSGRRFEIEIFVSPGGYILGEETALLEALEDKRGEPRNKPPYPVTHGLWGRPTVMNNVETLALATAILARGGDWWKVQGVRGAAGLKFFSVSGDVARPGVYEVPYGTTIRELLDLAGGLPEGKRLRAILPGGASSNFLPPDKLDTPLEFDAAKAAGSMLGSGAVVFIAEGTDLFGLATNVTAFFRNESCGKCVPCRVGSHKAVELLEAVARGSASPSDLAVLPELGETLAQTSICGLGQVALNPALSMLRHFPDDVPDFQS
ncbi:MAG: NADH-ubiquinone oxidoreductase-F iron-sulfur binding region domain-containing protein [Planctomycetaceae bacterium]